MPKLNDTQTILLSTAAQREDRSLYPLPETVTPGARVHKAIAALIGLGLAQEQETGATGAVARSDGDLRYGVFVTAAGLEAIGVEPAEAAASAPEPAPAAEPFAPAPRVTKAATVIALLTREQGATLAELITATGWLPHTTRAALTGLRKKGHALAKSKRDDQTCYRIEGAQA